jgi:hypothetical protein
VTKASDNIFPKVTLVEGSAPSSPAATNFSLFVDSADHLFKWKNSAGTVTTIATGTALADPMTSRGDVIVRNASNVTARLAIGSTGKVLSSDGTDISWQTPSGGANAHNENSAATLVNATSTGDAGSRADHFAGSSLGGAWSSEGTALAVGPTVANSVYGGQSTGAMNLRVQAYTPTGAFRMETRCWLMTTTNLASIGLFAKDSGSGEAGNAIVAFLILNTATFEVRLYSIDSSVYTLRQTIALGAAELRGWVYIALARDGSNTWTAYVSRDRAIWAASGTYAKTFTVAKAALSIATAYGGFDFFDVVS